MPATQSSLADAPVQWDSGLLKALYELVFASPDREVAGVFVGSRSEESRTGLPSVRAAIPATQGFAPGQAAMFAHQTWAEVHATIARHYPGLETVGWYVSRPGRGTALEEEDLVNHTRWFSRPDQILLIVDSRTHQAAMYVWIAGELTRVTEGPVARRYIRPSRPRFPLAGVSLLLVLGVTIGAISFIVAQAIGG